MLSQITSRYPDIEVLYCCESGSRMWGFASADSDYDVRFIYKQRDPKFYLELHDPRETIEFTLTEEDGVPFTVPQDYSGWDIKKALRLAAKSNVSLYEWTRSPIAYGPVKSLVTFKYISDYVNKYFSLREMSHHYLGLATSTYRQHLSGTGEKTLKKFLYVIRPLLASLSSSISR